MLEIPPDMLSGGRIFIWNFLEIGQLVWKLKAGTHKQQGDFIQLFCGLSHNLAGCQLKLQSTHMSVCLSGDTKQLKNHWTDSHGMFCLNVSSHFDFYLDQTSQWPHMYLEYNLKPASISASILSTIYKLFCGLKYILHDIVQKNGTHYLWATHF